MTTQELIRLINQEIDGSNSPAEAARLQREVDANPESRHLMEELKDVAAALAATRPVQPPPDLTYAIMRGVRQHAQAHSRPRGHLRAPWFPRIFRRPAYVFASGLAAGIALVLLYFTFGPSGAFETRDASGTVLWGSASLQEGERLDLTRFGLRGSLETRYGDDVGLVRLRIDTPGTVPDLRYDPAAMTLKGVLREAGFHGDVNLSEGRVIAEGDHGVVTVVFSTPDPAKETLQVMVSTPGGARYEGAVALRPTEKR